MATAEANRQKGPRRQFIPKKSPRMLRHAVGDNRFDGLRVSLEEIIEPIASLVGRKIRELIERGNDLRKVY